MWGEWQLSDESWLCNHKWVLKKYVTRTSSCLRVYPGGVFFSF